MQWERDEAGTEKRERGQAERPGSPQRAPQGLAVPRRRSGQSESYLSSSRGTAGGGPWRAAGTGGTGRGGTQFPLRAAGESSCCGRSTQAPQQLVAPGERLGSAPRRPADVLRLLLRPTALAGPGRAVPRGPARPRCLPRVGSAALALGEGVGRLPPPSRNAGSGGRQGESGPAAA